MKNKMKVFTNTQLPDNIHQCIMEATSGRYCNGVFIKWYLEDDMPKRSEFISQDEYLDEIDYWNVNNHAWTVTQWLLTQGCKLGDNDVLVEHSW